MPVGTILHNFVLQIIVCGMAEKDINNKSKSIVTEGCPHISTVKSRTFRILNDSVGNLAGNETDVGDSYIVIIT